MEQKNYQIPSPIINNRENDLLMSLSEKYEKLTTPSDIAVVSKNLVTKVAKKIPDQVKVAGYAVKEAITEADVYKQALEHLSNGFTKIEELAAEHTVSSIAVIQRLKLIVPENNITKIEEACRARSYDIQRLVNTYRKRDIKIAFAEGAGTGAAGFWGLPFNLVLSTFLYFRAVQSVAMFYGYNIKEDPDELVIASEVFSMALSPTQKGSQTELGGTITKILMVSELQTVRQLASKSWQEMAEHGGIALLITQMRALANASARKALAKAGKKGLENSLFTNTFKQLGAKFTQKNVKRMIPYVSGVIGAFVDSSQMNKVIEYADVFYHKRFLVEKGTRINYLVNSEQVITDAKFELKT